jgi:hypothetical protein
MEEIRDCELIDFVRGYRKPQQRYEEYGVFTQALMGQFYGRLSAKDIPEIITRMLRLKLLYRQKNGFIKFMV